jgi:GntR family transcriptional regulator
MRKQEQRSSTIQDVLNPDVPLHHQIYIQVRAEIDDGLWVGRKGFPGDYELAERFGVSVITARKALERLTSEGWLERGRGRRPRVLRAPSTVRRDSAREVFHHVGKAHSFTYRVLQRGIDVAPAEACAAFGLPPGSRLWLLSRLRLFKNRPHSVTLSAQPQELGERITLAKLRKLPTHQILGGAGIEVQSLSRTLGVSLATPLVAKHLRLTIHDPTLVYTFIYSDARGRTVDWTRIFVHPAEPSPIEVFDFKTGRWSLSVERKPLETLG